MIRIRQDKNEVSKVPRSTEDLPDDLQEQYESMLDDFAHRVGDGSKVLDAGCGYGKDVEYLAGKHGLEVVGVDSDEEKIGWARENKEVGNYEVGDITRLEETYDRGEFDGALCVAVAKFFPPESSESSDMDEIVRQMARVTEGPLYITFKLKQHTEDDYFVRKGEDRKRHLVKKEEAEEILEKHGYEVVDTDAERINERTTLGIEAEKT